MKFAAAGRRERLLPLDMTPMIDIVFQLLIFFLTTTQLARTAQEFLSLPGESGAADARVGSGAVTVNLLASGAILLGDAELPPDRAAARLRAAAAGASGAPALVRADRDAPASRLNLVVRSLREGGATKIRLAVDPARGGAE
ncbi:MAG: ExbD/TolR family protein [Phycisphaerales bacterium]